MLSVSSNKYEYVINKSKFIGLSFCVHDEYTALQILNQIKEDYKGFNHCCYAYKIDSIKRCSDDKEPSGTAGMPILNIIESKKLNHTLLIVVRYFGGVKLGAGALVRAYSHTANNVVIIKDIKECCRTYIKFKYTDESKILSIIKDYEVNNKNYDELISYEVLVPIECIDNFKKSIQTITVEYKEKESLFI